MIKNIIQLAFAIVLAFVGVAPDTQRQSSLVNVRLVMFSDAEAATLIAEDTGVFFYGYPSAPSFARDTIKIWIPKITYTGTGKLTCSIVIPPLMRGKATVAPDCMWGTYERYTTSYFYSEVFTYAVCDEISCDYADVITSTGGEVCAIFNQDQALSVMENTTMYGWGGVLIRGSCYITSYYFEVSRQPQHGTATAPGPSATGIYTTYTPDPGYVGSDLFEYTIYAATTYSGDVYYPRQVGTIAITVKPTVPPPVPPVARDVSVVGISAASVSWQPNAADPDKGPGLLTCRLDTPPKNGSATIAADCSSGTYQSNPGFVGDETFTYAANDGQSNSNVAAVTVSVHPAPVPGSPLPPGTLLPIVKGIGSSVNKPCIVGSCIGLEFVALPGSVFWLDIGPGPDGGFIVGKAQQCINISSSELTDVWSLLQRPGLLCTDPGGEQNLFSDTTCVKDYCRGQTELKKLYLSWQGLFYIGSSDSCFAGRCTADQKAGIFVDEYVIDDLTTGAWQMRYSHVLQEYTYVMPDLYGIRFYAIFRGNVKPPAPVVRDVAVTGISEQKINWQPDIIFSATSPSCRIGTAPVNGVATVAADCATGTYQSNPGFIGTDSFTYIANDGQADSKPGTVTAAVTEGTVDQVCVQNNPVSQFSYTGKQGTLTVAFTGNITSHTNKEVKVCPGTTLDYQANSTQGSVICKIKNSTTPGSGTLRIKDHLKCTDKPGGKDKLQFKVKSGVV